MAWVKGFACITALGDTRTTWSRLLGGESAIRSGQGKVAGYPSLEALLLGAVAQAVQGIDLPPDCGVVVGSSRHYQEALEAGRWVLPAHLSQVTAQYLGVGGATIGLACACATGNWAIVRGLELLESCSTVVVACADRCLTPLSLGGLRQMGVLADQCHPFSKERRGMVLAEGAAALVVAEAGSGIEILGWGCTNDAYHVSSPDPTGEAVEKAIEQALGRSGITAKDVDVISPHATGTIYNDRWEAKVLTRLFPHRPWICPSKGAIGHALGASALIEAVLCVLMLREQKVFPAVGLLTPEYDLNLPTQAQPISATIALNLSFGFGGQNTAIVFRKSE
ncbi:MAG: beta-ketoacyl synthase N-terminal-like domain-containing protein [Pseudanabaenaceae cyanobacterium SKYGB_i_bin29]|nr:beta-ketoacyl-ACP reductase [Pseudanabaenaceae cyanobacterium SKYG29]MDW8420333.1 beta-ketoacyl synthase N-terminal-like domain-containing protein [Pseudanabaenaceae cyanobacterium SKYGB_i_bin29]